MRRVLFAVVLVASAPVVLGRPAPARSVADVHHERVDDVSNAVNGDMSGHQMEGLPLLASTGESVAGAATTCPSGASEHRYDITALAVDITLNRYLDHDPLGRMYALTADVGRVRAEERANAEARASGSQPAVSIGLQGDVIQPLTLRALPGQCLRVKLRNELAEPASFHVHGSSFVVTTTGEPATAANSDALAAPGGVVDYEWYIPREHHEGTHYFHSHGDEREQTVHGLFGALVIEPPGSMWLDPRTGGLIETGWDAVIATGTSEFREAVVYYHEVGTENYKLLDAHDEFVPLVDPITSSYRPAARALNYRSEPFMDRLQLQVAAGAAPDESIEYSSYSFGDPATPMIRSYLGDDVRQRVVHGGSEQFHVHHVHGGSVRWRRQPQLAHPEHSERTDSQSLGPSEVFDVVPECPAGGCQAVAGDFMFHCHIAHHYVSGMWSIWRVYNTLQDGLTSTDALPPLLALPDGPQPSPAVASDQLRPSLRALADAQLPPQGVPRGYDASVWDWTKEGDRYLGEPETTAVWPGYRSPTPGRRPSLLFDPRTGALAYPHLRPHLGARPPFAPGHGPSPFASGPGGSPLCPPGSTPRAFPINAIAQPIVVNDDQHLVDSGGELFVLRSDRDRVRADPALRRPLALRVNAGEDCVDVVLRSELHDLPELPVSKVGLHIHFVRFDVQASDGVDVGFNYEQTVRPYAVTGTTAAASNAAGIDTIAVADASSFTTGASVGIGLDRDATFETATIAAIEGPLLRLAAPLQFRHDMGESVGSEFVRYRWFPDVQFGTAYFHDHVRGLDSWRHGLFGALVAEPADATWTDPETGAVASGPTADVHTKQPVGADVATDFRELLLFSQDDQPLTHVGRSDGASYNLRAEPLAGRDGDPSLRFSSREHGDPATPVVEAYVGDPVVVRNLVGATNEVTTWHLDGHWFRIEPWSRSSPPTNTLHHGISERYDVVVPAAGGPQQRAGDYLYYSGRARKLVEGAWGLLRVLRPGAEGPRPLTGVDASKPSTGDICPADAPIWHFDVAAVDAPVPMVNGGRGMIYALKDDVDAVVSGVRPAEPLVLHVRVGDCIDLTLENRTDGPVGMHPDLLALDPMSSAGVAAGDNPVQAVGPGATRTYRWHASPELGEHVALLRDWGDVTKNPRLGMYGAIVVGPRGAKFRDPVTGRDLASRSSWKADVFPPHGVPYRDFSLFLQDEDSSIGSHRMPYTTEIDGAAAVNYQSEPLAGRSLAEAIVDGPKTPALDVMTGDPVRVHLLVPFSEQNQVFSIEGHRWQQQHGEVGTPRLSSMQIGGLETTTLELDGGAGRPGVYLYGNHRLPFADGGQWGVLRVRAVDDGAGLRSLQSRRRAPFPTALVLVGVGALLVLGAVITLNRRTAARHR